MTATLFLLHILGFVLWMGGAAALMVAAIAARGEDRGALALLARVQSRITSTLVGPGAALTVITGLVLTFRVFGRGMPPPSGWVMLMQGTGLVAAVITLAFTLPAAARLRRIDPAGTHAALFDALRARQRVAGSISGLLALLALLGGVMARFG